jgi:hypothetical protein
MQEKDLPAAIRDSKSTNTGTRCTRVAYPRTSPKSAATSMADNLRDCIVSVRRLALPSTRAIRNYSGPEPGMWGSCEVGPPSCRILSRRRRIGTERRASFYESGRFDRADEVNSRDPPSGKSKLFMLDRLTGITQTPNLSPTENGLIVRNCRPQREGLNS